MNVAPFCIFFFLFSDKLFFYFSNRGSFFSVDKSGNTDKNTPIIW